MKKIIKFADLCSGMGGFRFASKKIISKNFKLKHIIASDIDDKCEIVYKSIFGSNDAFEKDVKNLCVKSNKFFNIFSKVDLVFAGFPCQPFSVAGVVSNRHWDKNKPASKKQKSGFDYKDIKEGGEQGQVFNGLLRIIKKKRPKVLLLENVRGLLSHDKGRTWEIIQEDLRREKYEVYYKVIDAVHWVPQHRKRIFKFGKH